MHGALFQAGWFKFTLCSAHIVFEETTVDIATPPHTGQPHANWPSEYGDWRTHEMSDHLPVWIELEVDFSNKYLRGISELGDSD